MKCILLAGGFATRLWPLTETKAKPLLHVKEKPLISHLADQIPDDIDLIVSTNAAFEEDFKAWAAALKRKNVTVCVEDSLNETGKKGALGATAHVIGTLGIQEDLLLIAGDNYFGFAMSDFIKAFRGNPLLAAHDIGSLEKARSFGVVVAEGDQVVEFQEKPEQPKSTLVSTGCYLFPEKNLKDIVFYAQRSKDDLGGIFEHLRQEGQRVDVFRFSQAWYDIGSFDAYLRANLDLIGERVIEEAPVIKQGRNRFAGAVFLGRDTFVKDCVLENCVVLPGCRLENCVVRYSVIDEGSRLSGIDLSHQMIRHHTTIEKDGQKR